LISSFDDASLRRWQYLTDVGLWPRMVEFNWQGWMTNFQKEEQRYAARLLDSFLYFSTPLTTQLFRSAFISISEYISTKNSMALARAQWISFVDELIVVRVTGERPSEADSGFAFSRMARDYLGIAESQLLQPKAAISRLRSSGVGSVVFVDDFVGSGSQFIKTWERKEDFGFSDTPTSFADVAGAFPNSTRFFYCTSVATTYGIRNIAASAPQVRVCPGQLLDHRASAVAPDSLIWRKDMSADGPEFVRIASTRAGLGDTGGNQDDWRGFHELGLSIAFSHGAPDANLGFYSWDQNGWIPLISKGAL